MRVVAPGATACASRRRDRGRSASCTGRRRRRPDFHRGCRAAGHVLADRAAQGWRPRRSAIAPWWILGLGSPRHSLIEWSAGSTHRLPWFGRSLRGARQRRRVLVGTVDRGVDADRSVHVTSDDSHGQHSDDGPGPGCQSRWSAGGADRGLSTAGIARYVAPGTSSPVPVGGASTARRAFPTAESGCRSASSAMPSASTGRHPARVRDAHGQHHALRPRGPEGNGPCTAWACACRDMDGLRLAACSPVGAPTRWRPLLCRGRAGRGRSCPSGAGSRVSGMCGERCCVARGATTSRSATRKLHRRHGWVVGPGGRMGQLRFTWNARAPPASTKRGHRRSAAPAPAARPGIESREAEHRALEGGRFT